MRRLEALDSRLQAGEAAPQFLGARATARARALTGRALEVLSSPSRVRLRTFSDERIAPVT